MAWHSSAKYVLTLRRERQKVQRCPTRFLPGRICEGSSNPHYRLELCLAAGRRATAPTRARDTHELLCIKRARCDTVSLVIMHYSITCDNASRLPELNPFEPQISGLTVITEFANLDVRPRIGRRRALECEDTVLEIGSSRLPTNAYMYMYGV